MASADERVVRTTLGEREYERFRRLAEERDLSVEEALRRAALDYVAVEDGLDTLLETVEDLDGSVGEPTSARDVDVDLYGPAEDGRR